MKNLLFIITFSLIFQNAQSQSTASEQVTTFEIDVPQLKTQKTIWLYLPKTYHVSKEHYPVIYMFDAQNLFDAKTSYVGEWKIDEYLDGLKDHKSIIVAVEHGNEKRIDELTPFPHETYGGGNGKAFLEFIIKTLKPHIDSNYRTKKESQHTAIFGSSLGGLMAFYGIISYPETFGKAGIFSPAFWVNPEIFDMLERTTVSDSSRFYFMAGTKEGESMVPNQERMVELLMNKGVNKNQIKNLIIEDGEHNEAFWGQNFPNAYQWLLSEH